ncbi:RICIN domain-containing protein [Streptomyces sp. NBC_01465]|uniref:RICIN domain-containing protein n=1 Tax=Streptomyces sp. NBC_01465 TaxID=2903878 RepID=UPI002E3702EC|nr:ricin-type beta-trefoil lectin domain protein [Streptomyces sp. NBC_01465]
MLKRAAAVGAAAVLAWGLGTTDANATSIYVHFKNKLTGRCLDYRADYGVYATDCNQGGYQTWLVNEASFQLSAMRQNAGDRLCLVARNGAATMKPCLADDPAALWIISPTTVGFQLVNNVTDTCLGEGNTAKHLVKLVPCSGGSSQQWEEQDA